MSVPQHMAALCQANKVRSDIAAIKRDLKRHGNVIAGATALAAALDESPDCLVNVPVGVALSWVPRVLPVHIDHIRKHVGIHKDTTKLGQLPGRQLDLLITTLRSPRLWHARYMRAGVNLPEVAA